MNHILKTIITGILILSIFCSGGATKAYTHNSEKNLVFNPISKSEVASILYSRQYK